MLRQNNDNDREAVGRTVSTEVLHDASYPLTLPSTVGSDSVLIAITLGANEPHHLGANLLTITASAIGSAFVAATISFF
jgi:small neutral amino acid transporter SnatA (MarC family)